MAQDNYSDDLLLDYARGRLSQDLAHEIETAAQTNTQLAADLALMKALPSALANQDLGNPPGEMGWKRLEAAIDAEVAPQPHPTTLRALRASAAVLLAVAIAQFIFIALTYNPAQPVYETASEQVDAGTRLVILLEGDTTVQQLAEVLALTNGQIVRGPGSSGFFTVAFPSVGAREAAFDVFNRSPIIALTAEVSE